MFGLQRTKGRDHTQKKETVNRGEPPSKKSPRTQGGLIQEVLKEDGKKVRPSWILFRSEVMIQPSERDFWTNMDSGKESLSHQTSGLMF